MKKYLIVVTLLCSLVLPIVAGEKVMVVNPITYESMEQVMELAKTKPTVLFFKANWCPSCNSAAKNFSENLDKLEGVNLVVVNYDTSKDLQKKYGVTYQHTFVQVASDGAAIVKWNGGSTTKLLEKVVK